MIMTLLDRLPPRNGGRQRLPALQIKAGEIPKHLSGDVRVATGDDVGLHILGSYASRFLECYPAGRVYLESHRPEQVYRAVLGNRAALGLVAYPKRSRNLEVVPLGEEPFVLACHPRHPLAEFKCIQLGALKGQQVFSFQPDRAVGRVLYSMFKKQGLTLRRVIQCADMEMLKAAVKHRFEVAIVPEGWVTQEVTRRTLVAVQIEGGYGRPLGVIYRKTAGLAPALRGFLALLPEPLWEHTRDWKEPARSAPARPRTKDSPKVYHFMTLGISAGVRW